MNSERLEKLVLTLLAEQQTLREQLERQRDRIAYLQRHLEELALAGCLSPDKGLSDWSQELGECYPSLNRKIEHKINEYLNAKNFPDFSAHDVVRSAT